MTCTLRFQPEDRTEDRIIDVRHGTPLAVAATEAGISLRNDCGGSGTCGKCRVLVNKKEQLACQTIVQSDLEIFVPNTSLQQNDRTMVVQNQSFIIREDCAKTSSDRTARFGVALDIGTTTLAAELFDLADHGVPKLLAVASRANPQRRFGDDVISRIQRVVENPPDLAALQESVVTAVDEMLRELADRSKIDVSDIELLFMAGNTVMEHLFHGIDPSPLGFAPFKAPVGAFPTRRALEIGLRSVPKALIETMPIFGGFVGGDLVAGVLATDLERHDKTAFLIDLGTNGELVLFHDGTPYTATTAAGPAFEGGRIEYGSLAVPGAIDKVELRDDGSVRVSTIGNRPATGICGSGLIDAVSELLRFGLIKPTGQYHVKADSPFLNSWKMIDERPAFQLVAENESGRNHEPILLLQRDIRQLQLASGAIRAGIRLLLQQLGLPLRDVGTFYVAGGFGSFIRPEAAQRIGLLPREIPLDSIKFCGNTSLAGARWALFDSHYAEQVQQLIRRAHHLDLALMPDFATVFADSMLFE